MIRHRKSTGEVVIPYWIFKRLPHKRICRELGLVVVDE